MYKVKPGWEDKKIYGVVAGKRLNKRLGELSQAELKALMDTDPRNSSCMIEGEAGQAKTDNKPGEPLPEKPKG